MWKSDSKWENHGDRETERKDSLGAFHPIHISPWNSIKFLPIISKSCSSYTYLSFPIVFLNLHLRCLRIINGKHKVRLSPHLSWNVMCHRCQNDALLFPEIILLVLNINFSICSSLNGDTRFAQKLICLCRSNLHCLIKYLSEGLRNFLKVDETPLTMQNED